MVGSILLWRKVITASKEVLYSVCNLMSCRNMLYPRPKYNLNGKYSLPPDHKRDSGDKRTSIYLRE